MQDLVIPETQNSEAQAFQCGGAPLVVGQLIKMLPSIGFNDQFSFETGEIDYVWFDYQLAPELMAFESTSSEVFP